MPSPMSFKPNTLDRFWSKVRKGAPTDCWVWTACLLKDGYGGFKTGEARRQTSAHRFSFRIHHGEIPPGMVVCHSCDNPPCVNPAHLSLGTPADNVRDRHSKGRTRVPVGTDYPQAKLNDDLVREIRASAETGAALSRRLGVSQAAIHSARHRNTWRHVA